MKKITLLLLFILLTSALTFALSVTNTTISTTTASNSIFLNDTITLNFFNVTSTNISLDGIDTYNARIDNKNAGITYIYIFNISNTYNVIRYNGDNTTDVNLTSGSIITLQAAPYYIQISNFTNSTNGGGDSGGGNSGGGNAGGGGGSSSGSSNSPTITTEYEATLSTATPLSFTIASTGEKHKITIKEVRSDSITFTIESTPQTAVLAIGETKEFDLGTDGESDIAVTLLDIVRNKANLRIVSLVKDAPPELTFPHPTKTDYEQLPPLENLPSGTGNAVKGFNPLTRFRSVIPWAMMLLIAGIIIYGYYFINKTRKRI